VSSDRPEPSQADLARPVLKRGLRLLMRDDRTVQLGLDPERMIVVTDVDRPVQQWLRRLDGLRERQLAIADAARLGADPDVATGLLDLLASGGALDDAALASRPALARLPLDERARLEPDLASFALMSGRSDGGTSVLAARQAAVVEVRGAGRVGACAAAFLAAAGIGHVAIRDPATVRAGDVAPAGSRTADVGSRRAAAAGQAARRAAPAVRCALPRDRRRPDLVLLAPTAPIESAERDDLVRSGVPHLLARVRETTGVVGPLVVPGRSSCLLCHDLARADRDPAWPRVAAQLATDPADAALAPCDTVLAAAVAVHAVLQVLTFIDRLDSAPPATVDGTLEIALPEGRIRRRSWSPHPACGCRWAEAG
jgi:hypothetical protein